MTYETTAVANADIIKRLNAMIPSERREVLRQLDYWEEIYRMVDTAEVCRQRSAKHAALTRAYSRLARLEAALGAAVALLSAVDEYSRRESRWCDVERVARISRKAFVELVKKKPKSKAGESP